MNCGPFPRSAAYAAMLARTAPSVREPRGTGYGFAYSERHLRCVWFDPAFRPAVLRTHTDEDLIVEDPGRWNLEAGPDFYDATLLIGPGQRRLSGDVEIHLRPSGWRMHGHADDPKYRRVIAHVTYFPGSVPAEQLPPGSVQVALKDPLSANPLFSFESLDVTAYPYAARTRATRCATVLAGWAPERVAGMLESAGEERLRIKAERLSLSITERGLDQTLYEEVMCALGYKNNRIPFRHLARKVPLATLREAAAGEVRKAYALLLGVAGLLPEKVPQAWDPEARSLVRNLWDLWWRERSTWESSVMTRNAWALSGLRPQNHPVRRLMAAALLFCREPGLADQVLALADAMPDLWVRKMTALLQPKDPEGYWDRRCSLAGRPQDKEVALIGPGRVAAILSNVMVPLLAACGGPRPADGEWLRDLPAEDDNALVAQTAHALFGRDHNPALYRMAVRQQGVLQIFHDFCLNDRSCCEACPFASALAGA